MTGTNVTTKILIVDDLRENILALSNLIASPDVEIFSAETPDEALNMILDHEFGLALLDVQMPVMNGFDLARLIRGIERGRQLPIIFVTAQTPESRLISEGYESGAVDVLFKPVDPQIVRSKVKIFVQLHQVNRMLQAQVEAMSRLKEDAEMANVAKSRFLANMSHEIRTPLSAVLGFADVLSQGDVNDDERIEYLSSISRNGKLLLRIIGDILDLSRIEAQKVELESSKFDLGELLSDLESTLRSKAEDKGIYLEFEKIAIPTGQYVSDLIRIKQVLLNVIGNAIKFTHQGGVKVRAESRFVPKVPGGTGALRELIFSVEDTGIGLSPDESRHLFEPFSQADMSTRRKYGGTGLGLTISKQLAHSLGGDVMLKSSQKDRGSIFEVRVRVAEIESGQSPAHDGAADSVGAAPANAAASVSSLVGRHVLVVDDVVDNRTLIERYLRPAGVNVDLASGGQEALDKFKALGTFEKWDVILMDIQMPSMDGYETTQKLRSLGYGRPIIALTAHAMREELDRCLKAGCNDTMTKPVARKDLVLRLTQILTEPVATP